MRTPAQQRAAEERSRSRRAEAREQALAAATERLLLICQRCHGRSWVRSPAPLRSVVPCPDCHPKDMVQL